MKRLTVLLATLLIFTSSDAQQILSGIYSGSMYNDTTKILTKYELALSEYRGKVMGYSYNTFIVNDTFYYGIRRVKGYKNEKNELVLTDEELLANNFPESPAKRVRRTATFPLAQEDTITNLSGSWQTNRTKHYFSVGGAAKTERTVDSSQSPLVAHLKELNIIGNSPTYQEEPVAKAKKKDESKPQDTGVAGRTDKNGEGDKTRGEQPADGTSPDARATAASKPDRSKAPGKDDAPVAAPARKEPARGNKGKDNNPASTATVQTATSANTDKALTQNNTTATALSSSNGTQPQADKKSTADNSVATGNTAATGPKAAVAATAPDTRTSAVIRTLEVVNDSITLSFYDNGVVDGDVISVFVNGENVIAGAKLNEVAIKKTVYLTNFAADSVEVTLVAETLGSIPPNTGLVLVRDGDVRYDVRFSADLKTNASIVFRKVKK
jgi:hypothetical protein